MRWLSAGMMLVLVACASAGGGEGGASEAPMPIYMSRSEVGCAFEEIQTVRGRVTYTSLAEYQRQRDAALRRAAARVGADAVLIPEDRPEPGRGNVGIQVRRRGGTTLPSEGEVQAIAIRKSCQ